MDQNNGGILGKINTPTTSVASGVWSLESQFEAQSSSIWPLAFPQTTIANSCRFDDASSDHLIYTASSEGNRRTYTISLWTKRANLGKSGLIGGWDSGYQSGFASMVFFNSDDKLEFDNDKAGSDFTFNTNMVFRDISAWYHIVIAIDTTQATEADRQKVYVNGSQVDLTESASGFPTQNYDTYFNKNLTVVGSYAYEGGGTVDEYSGYMAEVVMVDGQALEPTSFGATNPVTNIWEPIAYSGTYGTNGFRLDFANSSALGNDVSGNDNDFTVNNLTSIDQSTDTCSNNFCTLNPLDIGGGSYTFSNGNTTIDTNGGLQSSFTVGQGKWYAEFKLTGSVNYGIGIRQQNYDINQGYGTGGKSAVLHLDEVNFYKNGTSTASYGSAWSTGDILQVGADLDNNNIYFGKNGSWWSGSAFDSGTPSTAQSIDDIDNYTFSIINVASGTGNVDANFGNPPFSISSGNADANGHGNFEYAVPSGYFALCTKNLAEFG